MSSSGSQDRPRRWLQVAAVLYGLPFVWIGIQHFVTPEIFEPIVPPYLGWPWLWVHLTGYTEVGLGIAIMVPRARRVAGWLMVAQLALLYLANLHMWQADLAFQDIRMGTTGHLIRLAVQLLLIAAAVGLARSARTEPNPDRPASARQQSAADQ